MTDFAARISRVRMKAGGADVVVLEQPLRPEMASDLVEIAAHYAADNQPDSYLHGFVLIAMFSNGANAVAVRGPNSIPRALLPAMTAELVRDRVLTEETACDVVNRANGFDD